MSARETVFEPWWTIMFHPEVLAARPTGTPPSTRREFDVVVVGSGMAGYTAAILAHDLGLAVVMLEAAAEGGGTTYKSGAGLWVPNNHLMRARGLKDDRDQALDYMAKLSHPELYDPQAERYGLRARDWELICAFYDNAAAAIEALEAAGAVKFMEFQSFTGRYEAMLCYHYALDRGYGRHLAPLRADGNEDFGPELIGQLATAAQARGIELRVNHRVSDVLVNDEQEVVGVRVDGPAASDTIHARRGVVFATGGHLHNKEICARYFRGPLFGGCAVATGRGDLIPIAERLGGELANMANGWLSEMPIEMALQQRELDNHVAMPPGDSTLMVNRSGRRYVNEKAMYHERTAVHWERDGDGELPNLLSFVIYDDFLAVIQAPWCNRWPEPAAGSPWVISAATLEELADLIAARVAVIGPQIGGFTLAGDFKEQLLATVARFNGFARAGSDPDFHRGETPLEYDWTGPGHPDNAANPTMYPLAQDGPYHCIILCGGVLDTNGGPRINARAQLVRADGSPIVGLYGAGNCVASPAAGAYWSGGSTLGPAATFAYLAAINVAREPARQLAATHRA